MKKIERTIAAIAAALVAVSLASCSAVEPAGTEQETVEPAVEGATEEQVASVIAQYEPEWRETIQGKLDCLSAQRYAELDDASLEEGLEATNCLQRMKNMTNTTSTASIELGKLDVPESMGEIVSDTVQQLDNIAAIDLDTLCGDASLGSSDCNTEMLPLDLAYMKLDDQLNAWGPYL